MTQIVPQPAATPVPAGASSLRVFIAYRQGEDEGSACAQWLAKALKNRRITTKQGHSFDIDVYLDVRSPAAADWRQKWRAHLAASRAFVLVCTPGAAEPREGRDWLYEELNWWLRYRRTGPLLIDACGGGEAIVPARIRKRWPFAQRLDWRTGADNNATADRLVDGILDSQQGIEYEELRRLRTRNLAIGALCLVGFLLGGYLFFVRNQLTSQRVESAVSAAKVTQKEAESYASSLQLAMKARNDSDIRLARARLDATPPALRNWEWSHVDFAVDQSRLTINVPPALPSDVVNDVAVSPDGRQVAVGADDGQIHIYDLGTGKYTRPPLCCHDTARYMSNGRLTTEEAKSVAAVAFVDGNRIVSAGRDGTTRLWELSSGTSTTLELHEPSRMPRVQIAVSRQGWVASGTEDGRVDVWIDERAHPFLEQIPALGEVRDLAFSPDGLTLVVLGSTMVALDVDKGTKRFAFNNGDVAKTIAYAADGRSLVGIALGRLVSWQASDGRTIDRPHAGEPLRFLGSAAVLDPATDRVAYTDSATLHVRAPAAAASTRFTGHLENIVAIASIPGRGLVTAAGNMVKVWDLPTRPPTQIIKTPVAQFDVSPSGRHIVTILPEGESAAPIAVRDLVDDTTTEITVSGGISVAIASDGQSVLIGSKDGIIQRLRVSDGRVLWKEQMSKPVTDLAVASDQKWIASLEETDFPDNTIRIRDFTNGRIVCSIGARGPLAFSPDGALLATGGLTNSQGAINVNDALPLFNVWRMPRSSNRENNSCAHLKGDGPRGPLHGLGFSSDGARIVTAGETVQIWSATATSAPVTFKDSSDQWVNSATFLSDSRRIAATIAGNTVIWDVETGHQVFRLPDVATTDLRWRGDRLFGRFGQSHVTILSGRPN